LFDCFVGIQSLSREELLAILAAARAKRERDFVMILLSFAHGLRVTELLELRRENFHGGFLTVARLKGSLRTTQPLLEHANPLLNERQAVSDYLARPVDSGRLFKITRQRFWQLMQEYGERAEVPVHKRFPHVLKHSIAMQIIHTAGIENTRQYLGHKSISSTGAYLKVSDDDASKNAHDALQL